MMQAANPESGDTISRALANAAESACVTLGRLFAPSVVTLVETRVGAGKADDVLPDVQVDFEIGGPLHARLVVASGGFDSLRLANGLLSRRRSVTTLDAEAREALEEMANIAASSFLNHLAKLAKVRLVPSVPRLRDRTNEAPRVRESELVVTARYSVDFGNGSAEFLLVAEPEDSLMDALSQQAT